MMVRVSNTTNKLDAGVNHNLVLLSVSLVTRSWSGVWIGGMDLTALCPSHAF